MFSRIQYKGNAKHITAILLLQSCYIVQISIVPRGCHVIHYCTFIYRHMLAALLASDCLLVLRVSAFRKLTFVFLFCQQVLAVFNLFASV